MSDLVFNISERTENEKPKFLRKNGQVPCILYGNGFEKSLPIKIDENDLLKLMHNNTTSSLIPLNLNGVTKTCIVKGLQKDAFGKVIHVDFESVNKNAVIRLKLTVTFAGEAELETKRLVLETFNPEIEIQGVASDMPESVEFNVNGLNFEDKVYAKDIKLPEGISLITDPDTLLAVIAGADNNAEDEDDATDTAAETPAE